MAPLSVSEVQALCQRPQEVTAEELGQVLEAFREESTRLEAARLLRNCCALNPRVKEALGREDNLDAVFGVLKEELKECDGESASEAKLLRLRCCLQFLSNLSNGRAPLLARVARDLAPELTSCLAAPDAKARNFAASVVLLLAKSGSASVAAPEVVSRLCECVRSEESEAEFALFALHAVLAECAEALAGTFASLPRLDRLTLIDVAGAKKEEVFGGPGGPDLLTLLLEYYKRQAAQILTTLKSQSVELDPGEFTRLLALFCQLSGGDLCRQRLQADKSLLIDTVYLLRMIHDLGKESGSDGGLFAPARKVGSAERKALESHPAHGFKRDLGRSGVKARSQWRTEELSGSLRE